MTDTKALNAPVFVVGAPRSGTTMLRLMLNAHPRIAIPFESDFIPKFHKRLGDYGDLNDPANVARLLADIAEQRFVRSGGLVRDPLSILARHPHSYSELVAAVYETYAEAEGKQRWGDKDPDNVVQLDVLWKLFPGCRFVHIVRDGRGVANSLRKLEWGSRNMIKLARDWAWRVMLAHKMGMMLDPRYYLEIKYEDLVHTAEPVLRRVCEFLGEAFDQQMLSYHEHATADMPGSALKFHRSSIRPPDPAKAQSWRSEMSVADQVLFEEVAGDALKAFGYTCDAPNSRWRSVLMRLKYTLIYRW